MDNNIKSDNKDLLNRNEVLSLLKISDATLNSYIRARKIPHYKLLKIKFSKKDIYQYVIKHRVDPKYETAAQSINQINKLIKNLDSITLMTVKDLTLYWDCSRSSIYKMTCYKMIPMYRPFGTKKSTVYFFKEELDVLLENHRIQTIGELESRIGDILS